MEARVRIPLDPNFFNIFFLFVYAQDDSAYEIFDDKIRSDPKGGQKNLTDFSVNSIFCYFKNGQKSIFELGESLKLPKMQFQEKIGFI